MFKFKLSYVAFAAALTSTCVYADPTTYTHTSGAKVIDIEAPNAAGVSHNLYREFNVSSAGAILNNSAVDSSASSIGKVAKNNNLTNGGASVILNEVISNKASSLNGFIEVNGQKADVVIANPNGITCSGCSFINTNKAVLTTGAVALNEAGAIGSYTVTNGNITVNGAGMNAADGYAVLLADAINLNGVVNAKNALISAGNFTMDNTTGTITSAGKGVSLLKTLLPLESDYSIDVSSLGGVKANSITMVGNNLGFGVRNKGAIVANSTLAMTSNGKLINEGTIEGKGFVTQLSSAGYMDNKGTISTNYLAMLTSQNGFYNSGTITNGTQMSISAANSIQNEGKIYSANTLVATSNGDIKTTYGSELNSGNQLSITALGNINHGGSAQSKTTIMSFGGNSLNVSGNVSGSDNLIVQAVKDNSLTTGAISNSGQLSGANVIVQTNGALEQTSTGKLKATSALATYSNKFNNSGYMGGDTASVNINGAITNNYGDIAGNTVNIAAYQDLLNEGKIQSKGDMALSSQGGNIINRNVVKAEGDLTLTATQVINGGYKCGFLNRKTCGTGTLSADKLILNTTQKYASNMGGTQNFKASEINTAE